jgi:hypothetical protein
VGLSALACVFDPETGDPVFTEDDMEWVLTDKSFAVIDHLTAKCLEVSSVNREARWMKRESPPRIPRPARSNPS